MPMFTKINTPITYPTNFTEDDKSLLLDVAHLVWLAYREGSYLTERWTRVRNGTITALLPEDKVLTRLENLDIINDRSTGLQAFAGEYQPPGYTDKVLAVIVRGTNDIEDAFKNGMIRMEDFGANTNDNVLPNVRVHRGFQEQYRSLLGQFSSKIDDYLKDGGVVMFAGHSLGGVVSTLLALNYGSFHPGKIWNVTLGSPPIGNDECANQCKKSIDLLWRVKNQRDPICKALPPFTGYRQAGDEIHLGDPDPIPDFPFPSDLPDHFIWNYIRHLSQGQSMPGSTILDALKVLKNFVGFRF